MTNIDKDIKKAKNAEQDAEAKSKTAKDHAEGKPSSETLNKAKTKIRRPDLILFKIPNLSCLK